MKILFSNIYNDTKTLLKNIKEDHISEYSAQCAYYVILSFIPFIIVLLTMIQYTGIEQQVLFDVISKLIPSNMQEIVIGIIQEVYSKSIGTISISIIFTLWSAGRGLYALTKGLQSVFEIKDKIQTNYFYLRIKSIIQTMAFIIIIAISLTVLVFGNSIILLINKFFIPIRNYKIITQFGLVFATFVAFLALYKLTGKNKVIVKNQILGALIGAVLLNTVSFVFSRYLDIFRGFSITYGSLTTLILIMMWTYSCFYTLLLGAEINKVIKICEYYVKNRSK